MSPLSDLVAPPPASRATEPERWRALFAPDPLPLNLARTAFPPPLRPDASLGILDITKYFGETTGGIRTYLMEKARYVEDHPHLRQVLVVPGAHDALTQCEGVRCYRLRGPRIPTEEAYRFLLATRTTRRIVEHERPDLIEVGSPFFVPWLTRRANRRHGAPLVWFYHTHLPRIIAPRMPGVSGPQRTAGALVWRYVRRLSAIFRATLVASESIAAELEQEGIHPVHRVSLGVDLDCFHPRRRAAAAETRRRAGLPEGPLGLFLGRFAREKQLDVLLDAWPEVERRTGAALVLVGHGPARARLAARSRAKRVYWLPYQSDRDRTADLLAAADLYIAPGPAETFGLSALEALASGTPVLSVDQGGVADQLRRSGAGALYPIGDSASAALAAIQLFGADLNALGRTGRDYAERYHAWPVVFERIFAVYREIAEQQT